ncbi:DJ-1/PfpI family protein [Oceanibacterium hippocampi]|uniref:Isonitrile hydratase n=1 Tax=Oceanibacterium hippocampi TaxID=745714 RepID=A0A1Y5SX62_9PROT|nr:DJ-1/PfpI family protein [Oceanibacterium hippocampi]SLN47129.1 Isonitrile hydratase [Oceanibacterium hippocampi]
MHIGLLLYPRLTQLDLTGPLEVFARMPDAQVSLVWKSLDPVPCDSGFRIVPTVRFADCPDLDVLCVPGGPGQIELMSDRSTLDFIRSKAETCRLVTSVCTGSLVLAVAGLLKGRKATCHWSSLDQLALFGAIPVDARVVRDGNLISGAGVTSGIDFALTVVAELCGEATAKEIQLQMEYDPAPPFAGGTPRTSDPAIHASVSGKIAPFIARRREVSEAAARALAG